MATDVDADLGALVEAHRAAGATASIGLTPVDDPTRFGVVVHDEQGNVERFVEKPPNADGLGPAPWWVNAGAYVLEPSVLDLIPADRMVSIEREVFPVLVGNGLICVRSEGYWRDIGTLESFLTANADAVAGRVHTRLGGSENAVLVDPSAEVSDGATVTGPVLIGAGARIAAGAEVGPDVVVGAGAAVLADATVRSSVLLVGAQISAHATVERSAIGRNALVGERARVVNSALGTDMAAGSGEELVGERRPG